MCQKETVSVLLICWCMLVCFLFLTLLFNTPHTYFYRQNFCRKPPAWLLYVAFISCTTFYVSCELFIFKPYLCLWTFLMCTRRCYSLFGSDCCVQLVEIVFYGNIPISLLFHSLKLLYTFFTECHIYATLALIPLTASERVATLHMHCWIYSSCDIFDRPQVQCLFNWVKRPYNNVEYKN